MVEGAGKGKEQPMTDRAHSLTDGIGDYPRQPEYCHELLGDPETRWARQQSKGYQGPAPSNDRGPDDR